jgi:hypothetical protein
MQQTHQQSDNTQLRSTAEHTQKSKQHNVGLSPQHTTQCQSPQHTGLSRTAKHTQQRCQHPGEHPMQCQPIDLAQHTGLSCPAKRTKRYQAAHRRAPKQGTTTARCFDCDSALLGHALPMCQLVASVQHTQLSSAAMPSTPSAANKHSEEQINC